MHAGRMRSPRIAALALPLGLALPAAAWAQGRFADVPPDHWAASAVNELAALGILKGYPAPPAPPAGTPETIHRATPRPRPARAKALQRRPKRSRSR
jgi:S-layer family protein